MGQALSRDPQDVESGVAGVIPFLAYDVKIRRVLGGFNRSMQHRSL